MTSAPTLPSYLGLPFRILVGPFVHFDPETRTTDIMMFNSRNLGALIVDEASGQPTSLLPLHTRFPHPVTNPTSRTRAGDADRSRRRVCARGVPAGEWQVPPILFCFLTQIPTVGKLSYRLYGSRYIGSTMRLIRASRVVVRGVIRGPMTLCEEIQGQATKMDRGYCSSLHPI